MTDLSTTATEESVRDETVIADKARIRAFLVEDDLAEIMDMIEDADLSEDEKMILKRANGSLLNLQRTLNEFKNKLQDDGTTRT